MSGEQAAVAEAVWDALDRQHDQAYHVHAAECCWSFPGAMDAINAALVTATPARLSDEEREALLGRIQWRLDHFGPIAEDGSHHSRFESPAHAALDAMDEWLAARAVQPTPPAACDCPPCPGRGNDGHGMTHCAECCFGTGVEGDMDCPIHGRRHV